MVGWYTSDFYFVKDTYNIQMLPFTSPFDAIMYVNVC